MKKKTAIVVLLVICSILFTACNGFDWSGSGITPKKVQLDTPTNLRVDDTTLLWNSVEYASGYTVLANETTYTTSTNSFSLQGLKSGEYTLSVKANGDGLSYTSSEYSNTISYTRQTSTGNEYEDDVVAAFGAFDEINTKNSFLGYGIDIINASAIASKNVLMTYPIFDMDKLMNEKLLKSNEHYNSFESIEASSIEEFSQNMSTSSSITAGANVSAKGKISGVTASASASLSSGLSRRFTKTSDMVESQYFLEVIAENQSYWLVLQTSEQRYKEILSEEFKSDLYNSAITPEQLFEKYGTHLLTSVAMGGNICMYYTMYSYDKSVSISKYAEVSRTLKSNVEAAYGSFSAKADSENSFSATFTYESLARQYGIQIDKKIVSAGGGSFGINNETTLYENYYDWQKSLDTYPVIIGIKDTNSLYPIWNLLDLNVEGAVDRYNELYSFFQEYGTESYNNLCETYSITPAVAPTGIDNISVGDHNNYTENQEVHVKAGQTLQVSFDVLPYNANKYVKTFSVDDTSLATIDNTGLLTISSAADGGKYVTVTITAGSISKQIRLYIINTYTVHFNTRLSELTVEPISGILEGYSLNEPTISRRGYILEGWYKDIKCSESEKFDFENDSVTSNMTLYAKWVAIKPVITFNTNGGNNIDSQTIAYENTSTQPKSPVKAGYTFEGWYTDEECTAKFDFKTKLTENIELYAKWTRIDHTVTFEANDGTPVAPETVNILTEWKVTEPTTTRTHYHLIGWFTDEAFTKKFDFNSEITKDLTIYAKWEINKYTITFDTNGGTEIEPITAEYGTQINKPNHPTKSDDTFYKWDTEIPDSMPDNDMTITAIWQSQISEKQYTITFDTQGGTSIDSITANAGTSIKKPNDPTKEGYDFKKWDKSIPDLMPASDMTITALWKINQYTITFKIDAETEIKSITADYGTPVEKPNNPIKEGYTFNGWDKTLPDTMPAESLTLTANWELNTTTITYSSDEICLFDEDGILSEEEFKGVTASLDKIDGTIISTLSYDVKTINVAFATQYSEYYNFTGWFVNADDNYIKVTNELGEILESVQNYTDEKGRWIYVGEKITLISGFIKKNPKYISNADDLQNIKENGKYMLIDDIDLTSITWTPIQLFEGTIDGNNKTIKGLNCDIYMKDGGDSWGLFITINNAEISKINFENVNIKGANVGNKGGYYYIGTLASYASNSNISEISVKSGTIDSHGSYGGSSRIGGIIGEAYSCNFNNCTNESTIYGAKGSAHVGGIVGYCSGTKDQQCTFTECINNGNITAVTMVYHGYASAAGIVGTSNKKTTSSFTNCKNNGNILATKPEGIRYLRQDEITNYEG